MANDFVTVRVDSDCVGQEWWTAALKSADKPALLHPILIANHNETRLPQASLAAVEKWCESIPGWYDGPEYAPTPLRFLK